jgi:hypothetical protein
MPDPCDPNRQRLIRYLAKVGAAETSLSLLNRGIQREDPDLIKNSVSMLEYALRNSSREHDQASNYTKETYNDTQDSQQESLADAFESFIDGEIKVYKSGVKLTQLPSVESQYNRTGGLCKLEDCPRCFWNAICQMEETDRIIARSKKLIKQIKESDEARRSHAEWRQKFELIKHQQDISFEQSLSDGDNVRDMAERVRRRGLVAF